MKNLVLAVLACTMAVFTYAQKSDGIVYWSYEAGYHFDFDLDGKIDLTVPTQTKDVPIAEVFVYDASFIRLKECAMKWVYKACL